MHECRGELDPLLVAEAELLHLVVAAAADAESFGPLLRGAPGRRGGHTVQLGEIDELLTDFHPWVKAAFLGHVADPPTGGKGDRTAVPANLPGVGGEHPERDPHRGGLACAVAADETEQFPDPHVEGHLREGDDVAIPFADRVDLKPTVAHPTSPSPPRYRLCSFLRPGSVHPRRCVGYILTHRAGTGAQR